MTSSNLTRRFIVSKKYKNKFFKKRYYQQRRKAFLKKVSLSFLAIIFLVCLGYLFLGNYFQIKKISISPVPEKKQVNDIVKKEISKKYLFLFPARNYFLFRSQSLEKKIKEHFCFQKISIKKIFPDALEIKIVTKKAAFLVTDGKKYFYLDENGVVIKETTPQDCPSNLVFLTLLEIPPVGQKALSQDIIFTIYKTKEILPQNQTIKKFQIDKDNNLIVFLENGFQIFFNLYNNLPAQVNKLKKYLETNKNFDFDKHNYLDLRFRDKIYLK